MAKRDNNFSDFDAVFFAYLYLAAIQLFIMACFAQRGLAKLEWFTDRWP